MLPYLSTDLFAVPSADSTVIIYDSIFVVQLNPSLPRCAIRLQALEQRDSNATFYDLVAYRVSDLGSCKDTVQVIVHRERVGELEALEYGLQFQDMNFDGYLDILCPCNLGNHGATNYNVWLFNPAQSKFEFSEAFTDVACDPSLNESSHCITVSSITCAAGCYDSETYHVENNKPILIAQLQRELADPVPGKEGQTLFHEIRRELVDGVWVVTFDKIGTFEELVSFH